MTSCHEPDHNCTDCERLTAYRQALRQAPETANGHNAPVQSFGNLDARILIIGMAPGAKSGNRTGIPFIGDRSGDLLYPALIRAGLAQGQYESYADTGPSLIDCRITNILRCVPPENRPKADEIRQCRPYLQAEISKMKKLRHILVLGGLAHKGLLDCFDLSTKHHPFSHAAQFALSDQVTLTSSYHCSLYNVNTGRLTPVMFDRILSSIIDK